MSRDATYKPAGSSIVTVPLEPELHRRLRIYAASEGRTIKWIVTRLIEQHLGGEPTAPDNWQRFPDGRLKPFLEPHRYDELRDDDRFLYNRGPKPEGLSQ